MSESALSRSRSRSRTHSRSRGSVSASPSADSGHASRRDKESKSSDSRSKHGYARRTATVYDAVAGLITPVGFVSSRSHEVPRHTRDLPTHGVKSILLTEEVLFSRDTAPDVFEEDNIYHAHRHLVSSEAEAETVREHIAKCAREPNNSGHRETIEEVKRKLAQVKVGSLPDGDLCKAIHEFARGFYHVHGYFWDWKSLDETALLACAILLEETVRAMSGETGWKAFVEGERDEDSEEGSSLMGSEEKGGTAGGEAEEDDAIGFEPISADADEGLRDIRARKRRKLAQEASEWGEDY